MQDGIYFITFTCYKWLHLFQISNAYDAIYKWFDVLKSQGHYILSYVIMPNHLHALLAFRNTKPLTINTIVGNGKRFIAYEIITNLEFGKSYQLLQQLRKGVTKKESYKGKLHQVFEPSFEWKSCRSPKFLKQKLDYIHNNPCKGRWNLSENPWNYTHSSAKFYFYGKQGVYEVKHYKDLQDIDLTKAIILDGTCY